VLKEIERQSKDDFQRISEILATIVPNTTRVQVKKHGKNLSLEFTQEWGDKKRLRFEGFTLSDGTLRAIGLLAAVFQRPVPSLIAVECASWSGRKGRRISHRFRNRRERRCGLS
jgi:predicted ATPase